MSQTLVNWRGEGFRLVSKSKKGTARPGTVVAKAFASPDPE